MSPCPKMSPWVLPLSLVCVALHSAETAALISEAVHKLLMTSCMSTHEGPNGSAPKTTKLVRRMFRRAMPSTLSVFTQMPFRQTLRSDAHMHSTLTHMSRAMINRHSHTAGPTLSNICSPPPKTTLPNQQDQARGGGCMISSSRGNAL